MDPEKYCDTVQIPGIFILKILDGISLLKSYTFFTEFNIRNLFTVVVEMKRPSFIGSSRFVLTILCNLGVFQMMILRFNVSMAIVCMTKNDTVNGTIHNTTINDKTVSFRKLTTPYSILWIKKYGQDIISNTFTAKIRRIWLEQGNTRTNS